MLCRKHGGTTSDVPTKQITGFRWTRQLEISKILHLVQNQTERLMYELRNINLGNAKTSSLL
jgi:hypothetical protein